MKSIPHGRNFRHVFLICLLGAVTLFLYAPVRDFDFVHFDDYGYVAHNLFVNEGLIGENVIDTFSIYLMANWHPVTWLSYMLDCELFGINPGAMHIVNALIHTVNSILLFFVLKHMTGAFWKSFLVAALFAWHPLHVESVAWISERKDLLYTLFWFLSMWTYMGYVRREKVILYLLTVVFAVLTLMSKPMAVTLPVVLLLMDIWPLNRFSGATLQQIRRIFIEKLPLFLFSGFTCYQTVLAQGHGNAFISLDRFGFWHRIANPIIAYTSYLWMTIRPIRLAVIYPLSYDIHFVKAVLCGLILLIVTVLVIRNLKCRPYYAVGWFWYLVTLVPVIGILQVGSQALADRYTYVPLIGFFILVAWGLDDLVKWRPNLRHVVIIVCCGSLAACVTLTRSQIFHWKDTHSLFSHTLAVTENNGKAHFSMSCAYFDQENWTKAEAHLRKALKYKPDGLQYRVRLGHSLTEQKRYDEALLEFEAVLQTKPDFELNCYYLGQLYQRRNDPEKALIYYRKALIINPYASNSINEIAWILSTSPDPDIRDGQSAVNLAEKMLSFFTKPPAQYLCTLAAAYAETGRFEEAVATAEQARDIANKGKKHNIKLTETISKCLERYHQNRPYRDTSVLIEEGL